MAKQWKQWELELVFRVSNPMQCVFQHVLYACNLFSVRVAAAKGNTVKFVLDS